MSVPAPADPAPARSGSLSRGVSIRWVAMLVVTLPLVALGASLIPLTAFTGERISRDLGETIVRGATDRVAEEVRSFLSHGVRTSNLYAARLRSGSLSSKNLPAWERTMLEDLIATPEVASIAFGGADGSATWLLRGPGRLEVGRVRAGHNDEAYEGVMDAAGNVGSEPLRIYHYDPRERPWFQAAMASKGPAWTPIYFWFGEGGGDTTTGTGYVQRAPAPDGSPESASDGVLVVDVSLAGLSRFLSTLQLAREGWVAIVDGDGLLVAASRGDVVGADGKRSRLGDLSAPVGADPADSFASSAARAAADVFAPRTIVEIGQLNRVRVNGEWAIASIEPIRPYTGIEWRVVAVLPERVFLGQTRAMLIRATAIAAVLSVAGVLVGWRLSTRIATPLERLASHVQDVGAGNLDARINLRAAREFTTLSGALNQMAGQLKERIALEQSLAVAVAVQKSLLPTRAPEDPGLEIVGRTRYCDAAGGDYFDFIEAAPIASGRTLIAVGDVMGHGIGAALLMASARAVLHAKSGEPGGLAGTMNTVNRVLSSGAGHNQFMTMLLLVIDSSALEARWASAGHDPAIVFRPASDEFFELDGGEVPLGVLEDQVFSEYVRGGLRAGDIVFVGTDGVWETRDSNKRLYGKERLKALIRLHAASPCAEIASALERALDEFRGPAPRTDDVTFIVARLR